MCIDPATAAIIGTIATVAGTGMSIFGQIQQGQAASNAASYNAAIANNNAIAAQQQAATDEQQQRDRFRRAQAAARASLGISGQTGAGSTPRRRGHEAVRRRRPDRAGLVHLAVQGRAAHGALAVRDG